MVPAAPVPPRLTPDSVWGRHLRYSLLTLLWQRGRPCTITELVAELERLGLRVRGDAAKTVSDALRYEITKGRVRRVSRGRYVGLRRPDTTIRRHRDRLRALVAAAARARAAALDPAHLLPDPDPNPPPDRDR